MVGDDVTAFHATNPAGFLPIFRENAIDESHMAARRMERNATYGWIELWSVHEDLQIGLWHDITDLKLGRMLAESSTRFHVETREQVCDRGRHKLGCSARIPPQHVVLT